MPSISKSVNSLLGRGGNFEKLGKAVGVDKDKAELAVGASVPEIVSGLAAKTQAHGGVDAVASIIDGNDHSVLDNLGSFFAQKKSESGSAMLDQVFGSDRSALLSGLVSKTGLSEGILEKALPLLAPIVVGVLAARRAEDDLDDEGVATLLTNETAELEKDGFLSGPVAAAGATAAGAAAVSKVTGSINKSSKKVKQTSETAKGKAEPMKDKAQDGADAAKGKASAAKGKLNKAKDQAAAAKDKAAEVANETTAEVKGQAGKAADKAGKVTDKAGKVTGKAAGKATGAVKGQADKATGKAGAVKGQAGKAAGKATGTVKGQAASARGKGAAAADRAAATTKSTKVAAPSGNAGGMGWIGYALGLLALVVVLALLASRCSPGDEGAESISEAVSEEDASDGAADLQGLVDAELPDGVSAAIDGDVVTLTGDVASAADADAAVAAVEGVEGVGSVVNELTVVEEDTDEAAAEESTDDGAADLQGLVDAELPDGVSAAIDGDVVTLTGDVASAADADAAVAAVEGVEGVGSVVNELTVVEEDTDEAAAEEEDTDTDTDAGSEEQTPLAELGDITFDYNSAQLTAEGEAVVVLWADFLEENADVNVEIVGHTDSDGPEDGNLRLSQRRAETVRASLIEKGIDADRLTTDGKGESEPKVENDSEANKETNRRIEFIEQ